MSPSGYFNVTIKILLTFMEICYASRYLPEPEISGWLDMTFVVWVRIICHQPHTNIERQCQDNVQPGCRFIVESCLLPSPRVSSPFLFLASSVGNRLNSRFDQPASGLSALSHWHMNIWTPKLSNIQVGGRCELAQLNPCFCCDRTPFQLHPPLP